MKEHIKESLEILTNKECSAKELFNFAILGGAVYTLGCVLEPEISQQILKSTAAAIEYLSFSILVYSHQRKYN